MHGDTRWQATKSTNQTPHAPHCNTPLQTFRSIKGAHRRVGIGFNLRGALLDTKGPEIRTGRFVGTRVVSYV